MARAIKPDCNIRFRLREPKSTQSTPLVCNVEYNGRPAIKIPTGLRVKPTDWSERKQEAKVGIRNL